MLLDGSTRPWLGAVKRGRGEWYAINCWTHGSEVGPGMNPEFLGRPLTKRERGIAVALKLAHYGGVK
jgi:hypothetical protein